MSNDQLDSEIEDKDIIILADYFDDAEYYLSVLGLSSAEQTDVRSKATKGNRIAMNHCLLLWKQHNPSTGTLRTLLEILLRLKKEDIASKVCKYYCPTHKQLQQSALICELGYDALVYTVLLVFVFCF